MKKDPQEALREQLPHCPQNIQLIHHSYSSPEQLESEVLLLKTKNRIAFINAKFKEFLMFENKDFQKINSFLKMSLGLDDDGLLATALEYDNPDLPKIEP